MCKKAVLNGVQNYSSPTIEIALVELEAGIAMSNLMQEPSPWEDM